MSSNPACDEVTELAAGFVLGALEPREMATVREHLATCQNPHPEFAEMGGVVPYLAEDVEPVEPPPALWERIRAAATADVRAGEREDIAADRLITALGRPPAAAASAEQASTESARPSEGAMPAEPAVASTLPAPPAVVPPAVAPAPPAVAREPIPIEGAGRRSWLRRAATVPAPAWAFALAAVLVIVALGAGNVLLQRDLSASRDYTAQLDRALALAGAPGSRSALLAPGQPGAATGGFAVLPATGTGLLVVHDLAPTEGSQVYEAWVIVGSGAPAPAGSFQVGGDGRGWLEGLPPASGGGPGVPVVIALTREPGPGATKPTLPILATGKASTAA